MGRNRKYRSAALRFGPALKAFLLCAVIGGSGVGYVWQKNQIFELGKQIKQRESRLAELHERNERLGKQLSTNRLPWVLEQRIKELNLGLVPPLPAQVWHLAEPARETARPGGQTQIAAQDGRGAGRP
jgi:hypothetical protein